ncbi:MAG TPA: Uma2 family endonuclease [Burkholderiales bacterium]
MTRLAASDLLFRRYRIEPGVWGKVEMTEASNRRGRLQGALAAQLGRQLIGGAVLMRCSIATAIGIRCPDVAWVSPEFLAAYGEITPYGRAPEICVEVVPASDTQAELQERIRAYLDAGAHEVWLVSEAGAMRYFGAAGEKPKSDFPVALKLPPPIDKP